MVVAGEASGDMHGAKVIKEMKKLNSDLDFFGMGGRRMRKEGVDLLYDPTKLSTIGFLEALKHIRLMYKILDKLDKAMEERKPEVILLVDYSGFNMKVAKLAHKRKIPVVDYFAPSAWVWGKWRAKKMAKREAKIASVFPMEEKVYREAGAEVEFVGHPLLDMVELNLSREEFLKKHNIDENDLIIGILPGSREQEVNSLLRPMLEGAKKVSMSYPNVQFILPLADTIDRDIIESKAKGYDINLKVISGYSYEVMELANLLLIASGTATLEASCFGTPMVIVYKTSILSYLLGKLLVKIPYIGLPNIIADKEIVPELLQKDARGEKLAKEALDILKSKKKQEEIRQELKEVIVKLGKDGATKRVAKLVLETGGIKVDGIS